MKLNLLPAALLAVAGVALSPGHARAQSNVPTSAGDLILGFELSGSNDIEVDIGPAANYVNATAVTPVQFGVIPVGQPNAGTAVFSLNNDLTSAFSSNWASETVSWGVAGEITNTGYDTLLLTVDPTLGDVPNIPGAQSGTSDGTKISGLAGSQGLGGQQSTNNSTEAAIVPNSNANAWSTFNPGTSAFGSGIDIENASGTVPTLDSLTLYEYVANTRYGGGAPTDVGTFSLTSDGDLTFTPASVPEPSTWLSLIGGALFLGFFRLRRRAS